MKDPTTGRLLATYRVELPGQPILGNGKSDNQNTALPFSRGPILQAIDCNQEGYIEEAFKVPNALREFERGRTLGGKPPAIVGFREHIFSDLGLLGELAASSELCFGTLVQRTLASPLQSRYHYGHPDMLDKIALIAQGGVSKATKDLNLSEDIFAGMDATLRGHTIVHREYFQVGKGRDTGCVTILQFFSKLSQGTAQMTTSRQALRLGLRLGLTRLMGFYYAHIGYYLGQLHFYHALYTMLALAFLGTLAEATRLLPAPCAADAASLLNELSGPLSLLFLCFSVLPLVMSLWVIRDLRAALLQPLWQLLRLSPLFFLLQSRCIGHYFAHEFAVGGASYIPTGRGLAITHQRFHELYVSFAAAAFYPGLELGLFLALTLFLTASPAVAAHLTPFAVSLTTLTPVALLFGPSLFNPLCFDLRHVLADLAGYVAWLARAPYAAGEASKPKAVAAHSWVDFWAARLSDKARVRSHALLLPSKEMLLAPPLLLLAYKAMEQHGWGPLQLLFLALPLAAAAAVAAVLLATSLLMCCCPKFAAPALEEEINEGDDAATSAPAATRAASPTSGAPGPLERGAASAMRRANTSAAMPLALALTAAATLAAEAWYVHATLPELEAAYWVALAAARYFAWRAAENAALYMAEASSLQVHAIGAAPRAVHHLLERHPRCCGVLVPLGRAVGYVAALTVMAHGLLSDLLFGLALQLPLLLLALAGRMPFVAFSWLSKAHDLMLLDMSQAELERLGSAEPKDPPAHPDANVRSAQRVATWRAATFKRRDATLKAPLLAGSAVPVDVYIGVEGNPAPAKAASEMPRVDDKRFQSI